jgi:hypothetical protein
MDSRECSGKADFEYCCIVRSCTHGEDDCTFPTQLDRLYSASDVVIKIILI